MPTRIIRRTPATSEAMDYGYRGLLRDIIGSVREGASRNVDRFLSREVGNEELLGLTMSGLGGSLRMTGIPRFTSTEQALDFGRMAGKKIAPLMKQVMRREEKLVDKAKLKYEETKSISDMNEWIRRATQRQFYREALEVMTGEMP